MSYSKSSKSTDKPQNYLRSNKKSLTLCRRRIFMSTVAIEMSPLHSVEDVNGVTTPAPSQAATGGVAARTVGASTTNNTIDTTPPNNNQMSTTNTQTNNNNNTISAAADSSDNQPGTPQPHLTNATEVVAQQNPTAHHPYANHHMYANNPSTTTVVNQMYNQHIYSHSNMDMQQLQQPLTPNQNNSYPSYLNSYEQFYQQQQQQQHQNPTQSSSSSSQNPQQIDYINSNSSNIYAANSDYKQQTAVRYHPYLHTPTSVIPSVNAPQNSNTNIAQDGTNSQTAPVVSSASSSVMSPLVVSSTSPTSSSQQMQISGVGSASSIGSMSAGNPSSPSTGGIPQCKKCGITCTNDAELQEHIANVHGASPYGSSGYASSPYIKEEMQTPPSKPQLQQQQPSNSQPVQSQIGNPGEILDLDSQKLLYPPAPGNMASIMQHQTLTNTDPLHGLHSMQQRAGMNSWDQQEGLPPYMQQQQQQQQTTVESKNLPPESPYYQQTTLNKTDYPADTPQFINDKSFDPTMPQQQQQQQQQMMPPVVSSSPSEFPSTTTGGPLENVGQNTNNSNPQFRAGNFEPPSSSSTALATGPLSGKAANWKSNEARRPKTYNCTACNKWFTSSGHLKRHYNTTLHKNAVKSSGQPDPATLPISVHHHPARDPSGKSGRRAAAAAQAAANAANNQQQQQQPPNPVQPPEPPNSPREYGGSQVASGGLTPLSHYTATPSPNSMYQQQQQYNQYMPQSTTNASSPQQATSSIAAGNHLNQQTVMNGHPNALAGPSAQTTTPPPSSQMRGLLNSITATKITITQLTKIDHMEAATLKDLPMVLQQHHYQPEEDEEELVLLMKMREKDINCNYIVSPEDAQPQVEQQTVPVLREMDPNAVHHLTFTNQQQQQVVAQYQPEQQQQHQLPMEQHNTSPTSMQAHSPHIISHQQYLDQRQIITQDTYTPIQTTPPPPQQQQLQHNIMEQQAYTNMPLDISMQQHSNMLQLPQQDIIIHTTHTHTNMANMQPLANHHMHMELQPLVNMQQQLHTINTNIPHMQPSDTTLTPTNNITSTPSYHQLQPPPSVLPPLQHMLTYPPTITGNNLSHPEVLNMDAYGNLTLPNGQQLIQSNNEHFVRLIPTSDSGMYNPVLRQQSPYAEDQMTMGTHYAKADSTVITPNEHSNSLNSSPTFSSSDQYAKADSTHTTNEQSNSLNNSPTYIDQQQYHLIDYALLDGDLTSNPLKRKRKPSTKVYLPSEKVRCIPCDRNFTSNCYLTQHNKSFHSGEYPFCCKTCGKRYQIEHIFHTHEQQHHVKEKPFKCPVCPKQFHYKTDRKRHVEEIHMGIKKHGCDICEKRFSRKDHLRKHVETHARPSKRSAKRGKTTKTTTKATKTTKTRNKRTKKQNSDIATAQPQFPPMM